MINILITVFNLINLVVVVVDKAYLIDPYDWRGNLIYIGTMVEFSLKNELFYLGENTATAFCPLMSILIVLLLKVMNWSILIQSMQSLGTQLVVIIGHVRNMNWHKSIYKRQQR